MRSTWKVLAAVAASFVIAPQFAVAETDVEEQLRLMQERMAEMEDRLTAADEQLDAAEKRAEDQAIILERAGLEESMEASSRISNFLEQTDFSGWVAASYFYNFNNPAGPDARAMMPMSSSPSGAGGNGPLSNPVHPDHNSFQLDEIWLTVDGSATPDKRGGFYFEMTYGRTGVIRSGKQYQDGFSGGGNDLWIAAGYVEWMASELATIRAGKFGTFVGYEVLGAANNVNVTRGFTWNLFQPVDHVGASLSGEFEGGFDYAIAVTNGDFLGAPRQPDNKRNKTFMWHLGWGTDTLSLSFNGTYGQDENDDTGYVIDFIGEWTPADNVLTWINFDYLSGDGLGDNMGLSVGGRYGFTDKFGLGGRFEWARGDENYFGINGYATDDDLFSITATTDYELVDNLVWKVEFKWETTTGDDIFYKKKNGMTDNNLLLGTQLYYAF